MQKDKDLMEFEAKVINVLPNAKFLVEIKQNKHQVLAHLSGKMRINKISILPGDTVIIVMSPYDLTKGRITYRKK